MPLSTASVAPLLQLATAAESRPAPGLVFHAVDKTGKTIASTESGVREVGQDEKVTQDSVFWIASCSKLSTSIALMQLAESGKVDIDDPSLVEKTLPEVWSAKVVDGKWGNLVPRVGDITLRLLLTHQAGFSYTFTWDDYWKSIGEDETKDEFNGKIEGLMQPLKFQPGTDREYSIGIDWCGIFIERFTGLKLGEYMRQNIFEPCGLVSTSFEPTEDMRSRLVSMHARDADGNLVKRKHLNAIGNGPVDYDYLHSGGAGIFSTAQDYCKILSALLNDGTNPTTGKQILKPETIDQMFTNQVPDYETKYAGMGAPICRFDLAEKILQQNQKLEGPQGWGLSFALAGPNLNMGNAPGICNCFWVIDRDLGVAGMLMSQFLPLGDATVFGTWLQVMGELYKP
jgi:CubicO group peptidase (beta-lactamase class C family)